MFSPLHNVAHCQRTAELFLPTLGSTRLNTIGVNHLMTAALGRPVLFAIRVGGIRRTRTEKDWHALRLISISRVRPMRAWRCLYVGRRRRDTGNLHSQAGGPATHTPPILVFCTGGPSRLDETAGRRKATEYAARQRNVQMCLRYVTACGDPPLETYLPNDEHQRSSNTLTARQMQSQHDTAW